jgi:hypothetical protein
MLSASHFDFLGVFLTTTLFFPFFFREVVVAGSSDLGVGVGELSR